MQTEVVPIAVFINRKVNVKPIKPMLDPLSIDPVVVEGILVGHFHEMGVFLVPPAQERMIIAQIMKLIRTSPEIHKVAGQVAREKLRAKSKRIAGE